MKTKQEQIEEIVKIILKSSKKCLDADCDCCDKQYEKDCAQYRKAETLVQAGYGDVSEYKTEIERLKAEKKQAQIDVLNKLKTKKYYVWGCGELLHITEDDIDELIKEIEK